MIRYRVGARLPRPPWARRVGTGPGRARAACRVPARLGALPQALLRTLPRALPAAARPALRLLAAGLLAAALLLPAAARAEAPRDQPPRVQARKAQAHRLPARRIEAAAPGPAVQEAFEVRVGALLKAAGLNPERVSLLLYSSHEGRYLYELNIHRPMIAASNAKLVTAYAALRALSPDYRWRTRFSLVEEHDAAGGAPRQALLVEGAGDPTLSSADLVKVAWMLRSSGVARLDGGIYLDGHVFDDVRFPASWGDVSKGEPWFAPVSPFIVDKNVIQFLIASRQGRKGFDIYTPTQGFRIVSALAASDVEQPAIRVEQRWSGDSATFTFQGTLAPAPEPYQFAAAVERPRVHFYQQLRAALVQADIKGAMPLHDGPAPGPVRPVYTQVSPPLRDVLIDVNKNSVNLGAEVLLRTMGLGEKPEGVSTADGLAVLRRVMAKEFPEAPEELHLVDGSGLSRENRVSALLLVRLLNHVRQDFTMRPEFVNSLSVALTDGTLQFRNYPWRMRGRIRAKTGTLASVSNISGFAQIRRDVIVFSLLINDPERSYQFLQDAQDEMMSGLYDALLAREAGQVLPPLPPGPLPSFRHSTAGQPGEGVQNVPHTAKR
jgi:serine-type D-Ala-D-Ala carboxypeptidase/endopeptidase (penicillin-binding protein 4)